MTRNKKVESSYLIEVQGITGDPIKFLNNLDKETTAKFSLHRCPGATIGALIDHLGSMKKIDLDAIKAVLATPTNYRRKCEMPTIFRNTHRSQPVATAASQRQRRESLEASGNRKSRIRNRKWHVETGRKTVENDNSPNSVTLKENSDVNRSKPLSNHVKQLRNSSDAAFTAKRKFQKNHSYIVTKEGFDSAPKTVQDTYNELCAAAENALKLFHISRLNEKRNQKKEKRTLGGIQLTPDSIPPSQEESSISPLIGLTQIGNHEIGEKNRTVGIKLPAVDINLSPDKFLCSQLIHSTEIRKYQGEEIGAVGGKLPTHMDPLIPDKFPFLPSIPSTELENYQDEEKGALGGQLPTPAISSSSEKSPIPQFTPSPEKNLIINSSLIIPSTKKLNDKKINSKERNCIVD